jgi:hypothetical protein
LTQAAESDTASLAIVPIFVASGGGVSGLGAGVKVVPAGTAGPECNSPLRYVRARAAAACVRLPVPSSAFSNRRAEAFLPELPEELGRPLGAQAIEAQGTQPRTGMDPAIARSLRRARHLQVAHLELVGDADDFGRGAIAACRTVRCPECGGSGFVLLPESPDGDRHRNLLLVLG